ncbi:MAG: hypothetical protein R2875_00825 [Desulfobacterales bacterium]
MTIAEQIQGYMKSASWIRKMFEQGAKLKAEHGAENVFDFSLGNPNTRAAGRVSPAVKSPCGNG